MVKILLIQLDRFGDNLFVVPLIKGIKQLNPDSHITVLVRRELKAILESYKDVDSVVVADWLDLPARMNGFDESEIIVKGYRILKHEIYKLKQSGFDMVFNLNFNKMTTLVTSLLNVHDTTGFTVGSGGEREIKGSWANYMGCVVQTRKYNPFHIVDVYRNFEQGLSAEDMTGFRIDKPSEDYADSLFKDAGVTDSTPVIAFQPGASNRRRIWPHEKFSILAGSLSEMGIKIVILGTDIEKDIALKIKGDNPGVIDLTGKTTFSQLAAILRRCKLLVSNDTGTAHLASAVGTRGI
ncbi:MAG: glycosyltransferase family 9 protein, partial [Nitrospira sp.]|nr:glycosyltransferase family 9 protein [Nitrospira sp.]